MRGARKDGTSATLLPLQPLCAQADNLKLYEKCKYLESVASSSGASIASHSLLEEDTERRCSAPRLPSGTSRFLLLVATGIVRCMKTVSTRSPPFTERRSSSGVAYSRPMACSAGTPRRFLVCCRYADLNLAEKLVFNFSSFFLGHKHARLLLLVYIVCLHLLVSGSMYAVTHHVHGAHDC